MSIYAATDGAAFLQRRPSVCRSFSRSGAIGSVTWLCRSGCVEICGSGPHDRNGGSTMDYPVRPLAAPDLVDRRGHWGSVVRH